MLRATRTCRQWSTLQHMLRATGTCRQWSTLQHMLRATRNNLKRRCGVGECSADDSAWETGAGAASASAAQTTALGRQAQVRRRRAHSRASHTCVCYSRNIACVCYSRDLACVWARQRNTTENKTRALDWGGQSFRTQGSRHTCSGCGQLGRSFSRWPATTVTSSDRVTCAAYDGSACGPPDLQARHRSATEK